MFVTKEVPSDFLLDADSRLELLSFIGTVAGKKMLTRLQYARPSISSDPFQAGRAAGWEQCIEHIFYLSTTKPEAVSQLDLEQATADAQDLSGMSE